MIYLKNPLYFITLPLLFLVGLCAIAAQEPELEGRWKGRGQLASGPSFEFWVEFDHQDGLNARLDLLNGQALGMAAGVIGAELEEFSYSGGVLQWRLTLNGSVIPCSLVRKGPEQLEGDCRSRGQPIPVVLSKSGENPFISPQLKVEASGERESGFAEALERAARALAAKSQEDFEALFAQETRGMPPSELWRYGFLIFARFGRLQRIAFGEMDGEGAFVRVEFESAQRDLYVRLRDGQIYELTYVPPPP